MLFPGCFWAVDPACTDMYKDGNYQRRRRMKRTIYRRSDFHCPGSLNDIFHPKPYFDPLQFQPQSSFVDVIQASQASYASYIQQNCQKMGGTSLGGSFPMQPSGRVVTLQHSPNSAFAHRYSAGGFHPNHANNQPTNPLQAWNNIHSGFSYGALNNMFGPPSVTGMLPRSSFHRHEDADGGCQCSNTK